MSISCVPLFLDKETLISLVMSPSPAYAVMEVCGNKGALPAALLWPTNPHTQDGSLGTSRAHQSLS